MDKGWMETVTRGGCICIQPGAQSPHLPRRDLRARPDPPGYMILRPANSPMSRTITNMARNRKNRNLAISVAAPAIPVKPNKAAMTAITRKIAAHLSILLPPVVGLNFFSWRTLSNRAYFAEEGRSLGFYAQVAAGKCHR